MNARLVSGCRPCVQETIQPSRNRVMAIVEHASDKPPTVFFDHPFGLTCDGNAGFFGFDDQHSPIHQFSESGAIDIVQQGSGVNHDQVVVGTQAGEQAFDRAEIDQRHRIAFPRC